MASFKSFGILCLAAGILFVSSRTSKAAIYLTVNGQDADHVILEPGQPCNIEIVSTDNMAYGAFVGFWEGVNPLGPFDHIQTRPEAGTEASVESCNEPPLSYGYVVFAMVYPSPGVHFVFQYTQYPIGEVMLGLWDDNLNLVDSVTIATIPHGIGACCDYMTGYCYMSGEWDCGYNWLGPNTDCSMCQPLGACCNQGTGECYMSDQWSCQYTWLGPGSYCSMCMPQEQPGACCDTMTGNCYMSYQWECPYTWLGPNTDCSSCQPPQPEYGACCDNCTGNCYISQISDCIYNWLGPDTDCSLCQSPPPPPEIKVEIHTIKGSGITEKQIREWIDKANQADCPDVKFVVDSNHVYEPNTPYDPNKNEKCKVNIWGLRKCVVTADGTDSDYVSGVSGKVVELVPGKTDPCDPNGLNVYIKDSSLAHELNHIFGLEHSDAGNDPNNKMYPDNHRNKQGKLRSCNRKGTNLTPDERKKLKEGVAKFGKAKDAVAGGYGDETYDNIGDVGSEYIDLTWTQTWIEWIQNSYLLHLKAQVKQLSFENDSEIGFYIESDNCQTTGQPPEGLDYYVAFQPENAQIIFMIYQAQWISLDTIGITYEYTYADKDANLPPVPTGIKFELPFVLLQRRAADVISYRAVAQNDIQMDMSPNSGLLSIKLYPEPIPADLNLDGKVDYDDLKIMTENWLITGCCVADIFPAPDKNNIVNFEDLAILTSQWLEDNNL